MQERGHGQTELKASDIGFKTAESTNDEPTQFLLGAILLVIGVVAFLPMIGPKLANYSAQPTHASTATADAMARQGFGRDELYGQAQKRAFAGEYDQAIEELTKVINASGRRVDAYFNRGKCYMRLRQPRFDLALADFNRAIALDPQDGDLYKLRALAYEHLGNHAMAEADRKMAAKYSWHDPK